MAIQTEMELYAPIKSFLESLGFEVKSEVHSCDIVAVREDAAEPVIVELKRTFNLSLLLQGIDRMKLSEQVYLSVEKSAKKQKGGPGAGRWEEIQHLCRLLGLGLICVTFYKTKKPFVEVLCDPAPYTPRRFKHRTIRLLQEFKERSGDYNIGGSNKRKLVTAYREKALLLAMLLKQHGPLSPRALKELTGSSKTAGILRRDVYGWFQRINRGVYSVTPIGEEALSTYANVLQFHHNALLPSQQ